MEVLILHVDCKGDALRITQDNLNSKNFYACNPAYDKTACGKPACGKSACGK